MKIYFLPFKNLFLTIWLLKEKFFLQLPNSEIFALLQNSYIRNMIFYHLKTFSLLHV